MTTPDQDPWSSRQGDTPPDLDEAFKKLQTRLADIFEEEAEPKPPVNYRKVFRYVVDIMSLIAATMVLLDGLDIWDLI